MKFRTVLILNKLLKPSPNFVGKHFLSAELLIIEYRQQISALPIGDTRLKVTFVHAINIKNDIKNNKMVFSTDDRVSCYN